MPDLFLSYSREDQATARRYAEGLQREGFSVWWDQTLDAGEAYDEVTEKALEEARAVIVLWSKASVSSRWVRAEATTADRRGTLVPVMTEDCKRPIMFELRQSAELANWNGDATDARWRSFVEGLRRMTGKAPHAGPDPVMASTAATPAVKTSRSRLGPALIAAGVLVAALAGAWALWHRNSAPGETKDAVAGEPVTLAVLPFANLSTNPEQEYFSDGLTEELLNHLAGIPGLSVTGRTSSFSFKGRNEDLRDIARKLGVDHLLEGSVRRDGTMLRITAQLIDGRDGAHRWSRTYDREEGGIFQMQDEIARDVAQALSISLDVGTMNRAQGGTTNLEAFDLYLQWRKLFIEEQRGIEGARQGVQLMREAVALDPKFIAAWDGLAQSLTTLARRLGDPQAGPLRAEADAAWKRVQEMAPQSWIALRKRSDDLLLAEKWAESESVARQILDTGPFTLERVQPLTNILFSVGRVEETIALQARAIKLEPQAMFTSRDQQFNLYAAGRFDEAGAEFQRSQSLEGDHGGPMVVRRLLVLVREETDPEVLRQLISDPQLPESTPQWQHDFVAAMGDRQAMRAVLTKAFDDGAAGLNVPADALGDRDLALDALLRSVPGGRGQLGFYYGLWLMPNSGVRADPRFKELMRELGLAAYWRQSGNWADFCRPVGEDDFECK